MGNRDWFRHETWTDEIEAEFRAKLARARAQGPQYLKIQAGLLANRHPQIALRLIDEYFETGDRFFVADAHCVRAKAFVSIGKIDDALAAYRNALEWEETHPNYISVARMQFPKLVAEAGRRDLYDLALNVLTERFRIDEHRFHDLRYFWNGANAPIASDLGRMAEAREFAERALRAAKETRPPFPRHPTIGLVQQTDDDFGQRVKRIARASRLRSLLRLIFRAERKR